MPMRTTLDLPNDLIRTALRYTSEKTKTAIIIQALETFIRFKKLEKLAAVSGRIKIDSGFDLDSIRQRKQTKKH